LCVICTCVCTSYLSPSHLVTLLHPHSENQQLFPVIVSLAQVSFNFFSHYCCAGVILRHLQKDSQHVSVRFVFSITLLYHSSLPLLRRVSTGLISMFRHEDIIFSAYSPSFTLFHTLRPPMSNNPQTGPVFPSRPLFLQKDISVYLR
jgi:hypothetical protein